MEKLGACKRSKNREASEPPRHVHRDFAQQRPCMFKEECTRNGIAAVASTVHEGPECSRSCNIPLGFKKACTRSEKNPAPELQAVHLFHPPGERVEQRKPAILQPRQSLDPPRDEILGDCLQSRLGRRFAGLIELVQAFAPPGEADGTEPRIAARRDHVRECKIKAPEGRKCRPQLPRQLLERDLAVVIEPPLSDR